MPLDSKLVHLRQEACQILNNAGIMIAPFPADEAFQPVSAARLAGLIDHTLLKADAAEDDIIKLCEEARRYQFASVCIQPAYVSAAADLLKGSAVRVCTVIGFPLGATLTSVKGYETQSVILAGAAEVDMVLNVGWLKSKKYHEVLHDIRQVVSYAKDKALVKVILETSLLTDLEKAIACLLAREAGADFVKTSTGFSTGGATLDDIRLMRYAAGNQLGVKASGGVRTFEDAKQMVAAGATRIGASASVAIVEGQSNDSAGY